MIWIWLRRHPFVVDLGLVVPLLALTVGTSENHSHRAAGIALGVVETLALLWRRRHPVAVVVAVSAAAVAIAAVGAWLLPFQAAVALFTLAAAGGPRARAIGLASVAAIAATLWSAEHSPFGEATARVVFLVAAWLLGESVGSRRAYVREIEEKAERLEREHETEARRAAAEEQARIARELHDVVAHALSVIVVQAGAAGEVLDSDPGRVREPIRAIDAAARSALADLRRVLGMVHGDAEYEPQPGLGRLDSLIEQVRATGLEVSLEIEGAPRPLPAAVDLSAYRIVQEALTNTLRHSGAARAHVRVRFGDEIRLEIRDDGRGDANGTTHAGGLIGMRERVALLGGSVDAGSGRGGVYVVTARIPV